MLRRTGRALGTGEIVDLTGRSRPTISKQLRSLCDEQLVIWSSNSDKDPRATWALAD